ncbi:MAG: OmpA family protein [Nitrospirota bacterium]
MKSAAIVAAGIIALALLAFLCLPPHVPSLTASGPVTPANFHARVEHGMLILRGSLPNETSKVAVLQRAQELFGAAPGLVVDELAVDPRVEPVAWADKLSHVLPVLGHMTERGSIMIDGHTIVVSGQVDGDPAKADVLQAIGPLAQTGLELEDRMVTGPSKPGRTMKPFSPTLPPLKTSVSVVASSTKAPFHEAPTQKTPSPVVALTPTASALPTSLPPVAPSPTETSPASLQKQLNEILTHSSIEFESKSNTMTHNSLAILDQLIVALRESPDTPIEIGGHTDKYGGSEYNIQLSRRRADAVRRHFSEHGLTNQFTAVGYGASQPLSVAENRASLKRNRRIELRVKGQPEL